jgi:hypothetical protein
MAKLCGHCGETCTHAAYRYMHTTFHAINDLKLWSCLIRHLETSLNPLLFPNPFELFVFSSHD